jgi:hypothetical protein
MGTVTDAISRDLDTLTADAVDALNRASEDLVAWCDVVRDPQMPWAFGWAKESVRGANVAATAYILGAAERCGVLDRALTPEQKARGIEWIASLEVGEDIYTDPALLDRKPPNWRDDRENWPPDGAHQEAVNQYARSCLPFYTGKRVDQLAGPPPSTWPQKGDTDVLDWIKQVDPNWIWIGRIVRRVMAWYHEGAVPKQVLTECMDYVYDRQDPKTGFWGNGIQPTFKALITIFDTSELPVPRAKQIIDTVLSIMDLPTYDDNLFPCEEFDAFYNIALAWTSAPGYREQDIRRLAALRTAYILNTRRQADRGLSSFVDRCIPTWLDFDMAPAIPQGDAFGWGIYSSGIAICIDMLGLAGRTPWLGKWRRRDDHDTQVFIEVGKELMRDRANT